MLEIQLDWAATLYAPSESVVHLPEHLELTPAEIEQRFHSRFSVLKTILNQVVALLDETMLLLQPRLVDKQFDSVLNTLESIFWYAYVFNRETMRGLSFAKGGPVPPSASPALLDKYLGDVELASVQTTLKWVFALYLQGNAPASDLTESRSHRLRRCVLFARAAVQRRLHLIV